MSREIAAQENGSAEWQGLDHFLNQRFVLLIGQYLLQDTLNQDEKNVDLINLASAYEEFDTLWSKAIQEAIFAKDCNQLVAKFRQEQLKASLEQCAPSSLYVLHNSRIHAEEIKTAFEAVKSNPNDDQALQSFKNHLSRNSSSRGAQNCEIATTILLAVALSVTAYYLATVQPPESGSKIFLYILGTVSGLAAIISTGCFLRRCKTRNQNIQVLSNTISGLDSMGIYHSLLQPPLGNSDPEDLEAGLAVPTA